MAALITASLNVAAGSFGMSPMRVDLSATAPTAVITVSSSDDAAITIQARAYTWTQAGGNNAYEETRGFIISPPIFTLLPGSKQIVRVALRGTPPLQVERAYRLMLQEVPEAEKAVADGPVFRIAVGMNIPMFVAPAGGTAIPKPTYSGGTGPDGTPRLRIVNAGTGNLRLTNLTVEQEGDKLAEIDVFVVLAGATAFVELPQDQVVPGKALRVRAKSNGGPIDLAVLGL